MLESALCTPLLKWSQRLGLPACRFLQPGYRAVQDYWFQLALQLGPLPSRRED